MESVIQTIRPLTMLLMLLPVAVSTVSAQSAQDTAAIVKQLKIATSLQATNTDSCYRLSLLSYQQAEKIGFDRGLCGACIRLGSVKIIRGENDSAHYFLGKAIAIARMIKDNQRLAGAIMLRSYVYQNKGMNDSAFACLYQSLSIAKQCGDSTLFVQLRNTMGDLYVSYNDYPRALVCYRTALNQAIALHEASIITTSTMGIGNIYYLQRQIMRAMTYYKIADSILISIGDSNGLSQNRQNIALCYTELHNYPLALATYNSVLKFYQNHQMRVEEANLYYNVGLLYNKLGKPDDAIGSLSSGLRLAQNLGDLAKMADCLLELANTYAGKQNYKLAFLNLEHFTEVKDSLLNKEKIYSISEMQTRYETEKKEQQISLLNAQNKARSLQRNLLIAGSFGLLFFLTIVIRQRNKVNQERKRSDKLILDILPAEVADELKRTGKASARQYNHVTVLFTDFVNFTGISEQLSPTELVAEIHRYFTAFDEIMVAHGVEKIKTIGDAYMAVSGMPLETPDHAARMLDAAIAIRDFVRQNGGKFDIRIGIHSGPVVAGIVGIRKYAYDIWGDTVNTAARMEQNSEPGRINVSESTYALTKEKFQFEYRGKIKPKNKQEIDMYFLQ